MIDSKTKQRVEVSVHETYGPYIRISNFDDAGALEDVLDDNYYVLYWKAPADGLKEFGGSEYYFGGAADPVKLQVILDEIDFD